MWLYDRTEPSPDSAHAHSSRIDDGRPIRVGLVGAGFVCSYHLRTLLRIPNIELVAIADLVLERAERRAREASIQHAVNTIDEVLSKDVDVVHVLTNAVEHFEVANTALKAGCHVFVEKPFTCSIEECDQLLATAKSNNARILVDHSLIGDPSIQRGLKVFRRGDIGDPHSLHLFRAGSAPQRDYRRPYPELGDPFREVGTHALYCITEFMGNIRDASVDVRSTGRQTEFTFDEWTVRLDCEKGPATLQLTWSGPKQQTIDVSGATGRIHMDLWPGIVTRRHNWSCDRRVQMAMQPVLESFSRVYQVARTVSGYFFGRAKWYRGMDQMIHDFYAALRTGTAMPVEFSHARHIVEWTERITNAVDEVSGAKASGKVTCEPQPGHARTEA